MASMSWLSQWLPSGLPKFASPSQLKRAGVLGMNARNRLYISQYNNRSQYPVVDNKLETKRMAQQFDIPVPELLFTVESQYQVSQIAAHLSGLEQFVIKPAKGSGGKGILVIRGRNEQGWIKSGGQLVTLADIQRHVSNVLAGLHSLGGVPDVAIVEQCIDFDDSMAPFSFQGVPDIRVIVCRGYPVMAMVRLATRSSDGKANLHQGAVGLGLDLTTGQAIRAIQNGEPIDKHPDTGVDLNTLQVPDWTRLLVLASRCAEASRLGYLGADMVIDKQEGPVLLELNARPGLAIQLANGAGLRPRLQTLDRLSESDVLSVNAEERVRRSQQWFAGE